MKIKKVKKFYERFINKINDSTRKFLLIGEILTFLYKKKRAVGKKYLL